MNIGYALDEIATHWSDRTWWRERFFTHIVGQYFKARGNDGVDVYDADWDNLVVFDACRYDLYSDAAEERDLPGSVEAVTSRASATPEFLAANFAGRECHDTVYVTANPYPNVELPDGTFHDVIPVWRDGWDEDLQVVPPETMVDETQRAMERYPHKRIVAHFTQPHEPFIGEVQVGERDRSMIRERALEGETGDGTRNPTPFDLLSRGEYDREEVWLAYRANLERALDATEEFVPAMDGRTVVTSDHGNAFGEFAWPFPFRVYGHPMHVHIPALTRVPWHAYPADERRKIRAEPPTDAEELSSDRVEDRLEKLGYR